MKHLELFNPSSYLGIILS